MTTLVFNHFSIVTAANDFAALVRFTPRAALNTDVEFTWLVDRDARAGIDYDAEEIIRFWDVTTNQDKKITEDNQAGILSAHYRPGPYSIQEAALKGIKQWYLGLLSS